MKIISLLPQSSNALFLILEHKLYQIDKYSLFDRKNGHWQMLEDDIEIKLTE